MAGSTCAPETGGAESVPEPETGAVVASGVVAGVTEFDAVDAGPVPMAFVAVTVNV